MWQPGYDRDGEPFIGDESTLTPGGQLEAERRFFMGFSRRASRRQKRAARMLLLLVGSFLALVVIVAIVAAL